MRILITDLNENQQDLNNRSTTEISNFHYASLQVFDQIRMAAISESNINRCGSHCGVSIGEDGPSQVALEDLAMFWSVPMSTVFHPSDGVATEKAVELAANTKDICFIQTSRPENAIVYSNNEKFQVGQAKVVLKSKDDQSQRRVTFHLPEGSQESISDGLGDHDAGSISSTSHALPLGYPQEEYFDHAAPNNRTEGDGNSDPESSK
ncbi:hypothetical protein STEG23_018780 [Scotinomys teguina]